jgi:hypothetical protein
MRIFEKDYVLIDNDPIANSAQLQARWLAAGAGYGISSTPLLSVAWRIVPNFPTSTANGVLYLSMERLSAPGTSLFVWDMNIGNTFTFDASAWNTNISDWVIKNTGIAPSGSGANSFFVVSSMLVA